MKKLLIAATALSGGTLAFGQAAPVAPPAAPAAHASHDDVTSRDDMVKMVREHFGQLDANKDGVITKEEIAANAPGMERRMAAPHAMGEGQALDPNSIFDRLDANKDGTLSREEFATAHEKRVERRIVMREHREEGAGQAPHHMMKMHHGPGRARMIVMADTDKDGKITLAEAEAMALKHFDSMDANKDGKLTDEERRSGRKMMIWKNKDGKSGS